MYPKIVVEKQDKTLHLEKRKIGNPIVTQQQLNPVCRNHEDFYPGSRKSSLLVLLASLSPCPWGGNHLLSKVSGFVLWEILYCLLFFMARAKAGIEKYTFAWGWIAFQAGFLLVQVKEPKRLSLGWAIIDFYSPSVYVCVIDTLKNVLDFLPICTD